MSRTIKQLDVGTSVYIEEAGVPKEYILLKKDVDGCILLRAKALEARRMNPTNTAIYEGSEMDNWLTDETAGFMSLFNAQTQAAIVSRSRPTFEYGDAECHYISRRAFLLTYGELFLSTPTALEPLTTIVPSLMLWKGTSDGNSARICHNEAGQAVYWWESSPYSAANFYYVNTNGASNSGSAAGANWARPALNVSSDTIVSDEGAEIIYLMPSKGYREVEFSGKALEIEQRPKKVVVEYNAVNLYDVEVYVCNNYGDANPTWVPCTSGEEVELTNTIKQTENWEVGVKCYGKSSLYGYFEEPVIKMEVA